MNKFTVPVYFSTVKIGQSFSYGEGFGRRVYVKMNKTQARFHSGQPDHVYGFNPKTIVSIEP